MLKQKLHPFEFLLLPLLGLVSIFSMHIWQGYLLTLLLMALNLVILNSQVKLKKLAVFSLILLPALGAMFASSYWFAPADGLNMLTRQNNSHQQLIQSANLTLRLYSLALISFAFMLHMPKESVLLNLM